MTRFSEIIQFTLRFVFNGWNKYNNRYPAYVLVRDEQYVQYSMLDARCSMLDSGIKRGQAPF